MSLRSFLQRSVIVSGIGLWMGFWSTSSPAAESFHDSSATPGHHTGRQAIRVPLGEAHAWKVLSYDGRPRHALQFSDSGLKISVRQSAMPLFHRLAKPILVRGVQASGRLEGNVQTSAEKQGKRGHDDYALRIGLVLTGKTSLTWWERRRAPAWIKELFAIAPEGGGVSEVHFLNLGIDSSIIGRTRRHPNSDILHEEVVAAPAADGGFNLVKTFDPPVDVCAIWISADGDDTGSTFEITIRELLLETADTN